jgi:Na+/melibiose symporter-like transporter
VAYPTRLPFSIKFNYGVGQTAEGLKNGAMAFFLLFYYNQVLGLSGTLASLALGTAVIVDAVTDVLAGNISDYWRSRLGRRHPFMFAAALPMGICFFLLFCPLVEGQWALFAWLAVFANLTRTAMTAYHVPHIALGAEMTEEYSERSEVVGYRVFFATFGSVAAQGIGFGLFFVATAEFPSGQLNPAAYAPFAATLAALIVLTILWSAWGTRAVIPHLPPAPAGGGGGVMRVLVRTLEDVVDAFRSGSFRWLFLGVLVVYVMVGVDSALNIYMNTYFWEMDGDEIFWVGAAYTMGLLAGALFAPALQRRFGKRPWLLFGTASWASWQIIPVVLRFLDLFPENGSAWLVPVLFTIRVVQGACTVQSNIAFGALIADSVDEDELTTGKRREGMFFASSSFSTKAASGFGNIIAGIALDVIAWPTGAAIRSAADVPADTLWNLGFVYGPLVAGCALGSLWCYTRYSLTRERHREILETLQARRVAPQPVASG